jgi:CheY-like chemotaxis protein
MAAEVIENGVIVADNDNLIRGVVRSILEHSGLRVFLACDGIEAVDYAKRMVGLLVILDLHMPKLNGLCACEAIRQLPGYACVPIVILTAYDDMLMRLAAARAGATVFFAKPFTATDLLAGITPLLSPCVWRDAMQAVSNRPAPVVWPRQQEPASLCDEPPELSHGRRVLSIYRR